MPRRRSQSEQRALVLAVGSVAVALLLLVGLAWFVSRGDVELSSLGPQEFEVGRTDRLAEEIEERGPFLFADASGRRVNDVYIVHAGTSLEANWRAIDAGERGCTLEWDGTQFRDPCTEDTYPLSGEGLERFATRVEDGTLYVDLRAAEE